MSIAIKEVQHFPNGISKSEFEASLQKLQDQVRIIDQKLVTKVEREITVQYKKQKNELALIRSFSSSKA
ncbi:hypothetical protein [Oceanobacillus bengalensis]|uniref:Uncharacterized protein n=1 Tax=Oceanobacillus bengalensis TaxID=1435466 RepID=A0A494YV73_9BACI|nr:hypothetical protein [Oceanobacillus bengalensis]RKQ13923.1 hypothetical protein D8M05_14655 [Oceanobacillus bengalensis]